MLLYGCLYIGVSGPVTGHTVFEDVQEIQPRHRITATTSQSHNELSTNVPFFRAGQGGGWGQVKVEDGGVVLSSLRPRYCALVLTVDILRWRGAHSFCFVNILEHSGCSGGSPGALYLNNIIISRYLCIIISAVKLFNY